MTPRAVHARRPGKRSRKAWCGVQSKRTTLLLPVTCGRCSRLLARKVSEHKAPTSTEPLTEDLLSELARARCPVRFTVFTGLNDLTLTRRMQLIAEAEIASEKTGGREATTAALLLIEGAERIVALEKELETVKGGTT